MEKKQIIELWEKTGISHATFTFDCGGDSMGNTEFEFTTESGEDISTETFDTLHDFFDNEIYNHVDFYVNSDGHYLGENGTVEIFLNDERDFEYSKSSTEEFSETESHEVRVPLSEEQKRVLQTYVKDLIVSTLDWDESEQIIFSDDNVISDGDLAMIEDLIAQIKEQCEDETDELVSNIEAIEGFTFDLTNEDSNEIDINDEGLLVYVNFNGIITREG